MTKHTTCLTRPAIAGAAALGLTSLVLLAPTAHAAAPSADRPETPTSAFSVSLTPVNTPDVAPAAGQDAAQDASQDASGEALEEDRSGHVTAADASMTEGTGASEAPEATASTEKSEDAGTVEGAEAPADAPAAGSQAAAEDGVTAEDGAAPDAAGNEGSGASAEAAEDAEAAAAEDTAQEVATAPGDAAASDETASGETAPGSATAEQVGGNLTLWVDAENDVLCVETALTGVTPDAASVHLHGAGGVQLDLPASSGCLPADGALIEADPAAYYVDVHTDGSSEAAARGDLTRVPLGGVDAGQGAAGAPDWALPAAGAAVLAAGGAAVAMARRNRGTA